MIRAERLALLPDKGTVHSIAFSLDVRHVGVVIRDGGGYGVEIDGKPAGAFDDLCGDPDFLSDGRPLIVALADGRWRVLIDGRPGPDYDEIDYPVFSADGSRYAYRARRADRWRVVADDRTFEDHDEVSDLAFSPDGRRIAFTAIDGGRSRAFLGDERIGSEYDESWNPLMSPDSKRIAYAAKRRGREGVVFDGVVREFYDTVDEMVFSPDSAELAYSVESESKSFVVRGTSLGTRYDAVRGLVYSPDSSHLAYMAGKADRWLPVVDGEEGPPFIEIDGLQFGPDGRGIIYKTQHPTAMVVDGVVHKHEWIGDVAVDANGNRIAYAVMTESLWDQEKAFVIDGMHRIGPYGSIADLQFTPAGHLVYVDGRGDRCGLVVDGKEVAERDAIDTPIFDSATGRLIYGTRRGNELWREELDLFH